MWPVGKSLLRWGAIGALFLSSVSAASVAPPTPERLAMMEKRDALEYHARAAFGDTGLIEKLRDWRKTWGFVPIGQEGVRRVPKLLIKDEYGWYQMRPGETRRQSLSIGQWLRLPPKNRRIERNSWSITVGDCGSCAP